MKIGDRIENQVIETNEKGSTPYVVMMLLHPVTGEQVKIVFLLDGIKIEP